MTYITTTADDFLSGRGVSYWGTIALVLAGFATATGAAAWMTDSDLVVSISDPPSPKATYTLLFDARFSPGSASDSFSADLQPLRFMPPELDGKFQEAKVRLAQQLRAQIRQTGL